MKRPFDMEQVIGSILSVGVILSAVCLVAGLFWQWKLTGNPQLNYSLTGTNLFRFFINDMVRLKSDGFHPPLIINLGIALLLFTPYVHASPPRLFTSLSLNAT